APEHRIHLRHGDGDAEVGKAGDAIGANAAWHDSGKVLQRRIDVEGDAVKGDPAADADADRGNLVGAIFAVAAIFVGARHPDADCARPPFSVDIEGGKAGDKPVFEGGDVPADVLLALLQVEHHVSH